MHDEDMTLALRATAGDRGAFEQLLERHYALMFRVALRYCQHRQDAEDIAQEVAIGLVDKLRAFRGTSKFTTWLYRVVINHCRDHQKKQGAGARHDAGYYELQAMERAEKSEHLGQLAWIYHAIGSLEESLKETAWLVLGEECSHAEAAQVLNCKESTVSWRMHQVRAKLTAMKEQGDVG